MDADVRDLLALAQVVRSHLTGRRVTFKLIWKKEMRADFQWGQISATLHVLNAELLRHERQRGAECTRGDHRHLKGEPGRTLPSASRPNIIRNWLRGNGFELD